jgi:hypothetical protein
MQVRTTDDNQVKYEARTIKLKSARGLENFVFYIHFYLFRQFHEIFQRLQAGLPAFLRVKLRGGINSRRPC